MLISQKNTDNNLIPFLGNVYAGIHARYLGNSTITNSTTYLKYVNSLMKIDGIDKDNAQNTFELCFFMYYSMYFGNKTYNVKELKKYYDKYYGTALFPRWHEANDDMFFKILSYFSTRIRYYFEKIKNKILFREVLNNNMLSKDTNLLLPSLLNKKSKYHKNFIPIYETIVNQPNNNIEW